MQYGKTKGYNLETANGQAFERTDFRFTRRQRHDEN